jgi:hypothetical protein
MKTFLIAFIFLSFTAYSQTKIKTETLSNSKSEILIRCASTIRNNETPVFVVDGVVVDNIDGLSPNDVLAIEVLKYPEIISCYGGLANGAVIISTKDKPSKTIKIKKDYPFKVYEICNTNWTNLQEIYNAINIKVPGVRVLQTTNLSTPNIRMRGDDNTIVIVDGVQRDISILNTLNPDNIESVKVATGVAATNYLRHN